MTFHHWNRLFLMGAVILSLVLPWTNDWFGVLRTDTQYVPWSYLAEEVVIYASDQKGKVLSAGQVTNVPWISIIYITGLIFVFFRLIAGLGKINKMYASGKKYLDGNFTIVETGNNHLPFSFFHLIFLHRYDREDRDTRAILRHEQIHASQFHSLDILLIECVQAFYWFLPVIPAYKKALRQIHECLADEEICRTMTIKDYVHILLKEQESAMQVRLGNPFFQSQIKQRLDMLTKKKNHGYFRLLYAMFLPLAAGLSLAFSNPDLPQEIPGIAMTKLFARDTVPTPPTPPQAPKSPKKAKGEKMSDAPTTPSPPPPPSAPEGSKQIPPPPPPPPAKSREIFKKVEEMPRFIHDACESLHSKQEKYDCAQGKFMEYLVTHLVYPEAAKKDSVVGQVIVQFVVDKKGGMVDFAIIRDIGHGCGQAVETALHDLLGKPGIWMPGRQLGNAVEVLYTIPVKFKLD